MQFQDGLVESAEEKNRNAARGEPFYVVLRSFRPKYAGLFQVSWSDTVNDLNARIRALLLSECQFDAQHIATAFRGKDLLDDHMLSDAFSDISTEDLHKSTLIVTRALPRE